MQTTIQETWEGYIIKVNGKTKEFLQRYRGPFNNDKTINLTERSKNNMYEQNEAKTKMMKGKKTIIIENVNTVL